MITRTCVLLVMVLIAGTWVRGSEPREVQLTEPLTAFPMNLALWRGVEAPPVNEEVARVLAADDYVNRVYRNADGSAVGLWLAFYGSQRQGEAIHSPLNCLPGTGWRPVEHARTVLHVNGQTFPVNRYVVQKRGQRQLVTYWFQGRGRIVASEYANKAYLLVDAMRLRRTDGALVRLITPIDRNEARADAAIATFASVLQPYLARWIP